MSDDFDEDLYLAVNDDVRMAVANGGFKSGYEHWLMYGKQEEALGNRRKHLSLSPNQQEELKLRAKFGGNVIKIIEVVNSSPMPEILYSHCIDYPKNGEVDELNDFKKYYITIVGWVIAKQSVAVAVEITAEATADTITVALAVATILP